MLQLIANDNVIEVLGEGRTQKTLRFQAHSGDRIVIQDAQEKHTQIKIKTKKIDDDLYVFEDGVNVPSVIIKDYFAIDEISVYAYNENGVLVRCEYAQINNVDGLLNLSIPEKMEFGMGQLALGGLAIGVVGAIGGGGGGSNADTTSPNAPTVSLSDDDNNGMPTASGLAEANSIVTIIWADGSKSTTTADGDGKYSIEASSVQLDGDVTATATDSSGNESSISEIKYEDKQAPQAPTLSIEDADGNGKPNAHGTAEPGSVVTIIWPDKTTSTATTDNTGNYSAESPNIQPTGEVSVVTTDANSNIGISSTEIIYKDKQPPTATITVEDTQLIINETSTITITFSEAVKDFSKEDVIVENGTLSDFITTDNVTWSATFTPDVDVEDITNTITLNNTYTDISNNTGTTAISDNYKMDTKAPQAIDDNSTMTEDDNDVSGDVLLNDTNTDGSEIVAMEGSADGAYGTLSLNNNGTYTYTRNATNLNNIASKVSDIFTYKITDSAGNTTEGEITIDITPLNDTPTIIGNISGTGNEDNKITGTLNVTDVDGMTDDTYFTITSDGTNGKATIDAKTGAWNYEPNDNYNGSDSFVVTITDDQGFTTTQTIDITVNPISNTLSWVIGDTGTDILDNFDTEGTTHDVLNIDELLQSEYGDASNIGNLLDYIHIEAGTDSTIHISSSGEFTSGIYDFSTEDTTIILKNVNLSSFGANDEEMIVAMISQGILVA